MNSVFIDHPPASILTAIGTSRGGSPQPEMIIELKLSAPRLLLAALHEVASRVNLASRSERWVVQIDDSRGEGRVFLELYGVSHAEADRGFEVLQKVKADIAREIVAAREAAGYVFVTEVVS